jgi:hypothetical protein
MKSSIVPSAILFFILSKVYTFLHVLYSIGKQNISKRLYYSSNATLWITSIDKKRDMR